MMEEGWGEAGWGGGGQLIMSKMIALHTFGQKSKDDIYIPFQ
jgi:hypothetical protein